MKKYFGIILLILFYSSETFAVENKSWKFLDNYLTPKCFVYEWMSSDNLRLLSKMDQMLSKLILINSDMSSQQKSDFFKRIGHYFKKYIPLNETFEASWGKDNLTLTTFLNDCSTKRILKSTMKKIFTRLLLMINIKMKI